MSTNIEFIFSIKDMVLELTPLLAIFSNSRFSNITCMHMEYIAHANSRDIIKLIYCEKLLHLFMQNAILSLLNYFQDSEIRDFVNYY